MPGSASTSGSDVRLTPDETYTSGCTRVYWFHYESTIESPVVSSADAAPHQQPTDPMLPLPAHPRSNASVVSSHISHPSSRRHSTPSPRFQSMKINPLSAPTHSDCRQAPNRPRPPLPPPCNKTYPPPPAPNKVSTLAVQQALKTTLQPRPRLALYKRTRQTGFAPNRTPYTLPHGLVPLAPPVSSPCACSLAPLPPRWPALVAVSEEAVGPHVAPLQLPGGAVQPGACSAAGRRLAHHLGTCTTWMSVGRVCVWVGGGGGGKEVTKVNSTEKLHVS